MAKITWINVIMIFTVFILFTGMAGAQDNPPNMNVVGLQGSATIGGNPAPPGTAITAKVGTTVVGIATVQTAGKYGDQPYNKLGVNPANDGAIVDIYVNDVKVATYKYSLNDGGKTVNMALSAPAPSQPSAGGGNGGGGGGGGVSGGGVSGGGITATATAVQQAVSPAVSPIVAKETAGLSVTPPSGISTYAILGVIGILIIAGIIVMVLRKK